jgi:Gly-Xaa carboxypeptidase
MPRRFRKLIKRSVRSNRALRALEKHVFKDSNLKSLAGTTQAVDVIQGGVKSNALPERAWAIVNHRVSTERLVFRIFS